MSLRVRSIKKEYGNFPFSNVIILNQNYIVIISIYLPGHLHIFPVHFNLNHSKSYGSSQMYIIIGVYHIILLLLFCVACRPEIV